MLAHTQHDVQVFRRHVHANRLQGIDNEWLTPAQAKAFLSARLDDRSRDVRYPGAGRRVATAWRRRSA